MGTERNESVNHDTRMSTQFHVETRSWKTVSMDRSWYRASLCSVQTCIKAQLKCFKLVFFINTRCSQILFNTDMAVGRVLSYVYIYKPAQALQRILPNRSHQTVSISIITLPPIINEPINFATNKSFKPQTQLLNYIYIIH